MNELDLISAAQEGFRKWLTNAELKDFIEAERARVSKAPELFMVAFNKTQGFVKLDAAVVKMTRVVDEAGKLLDLELQVVNDVITDPITIMASVFQPDVHPRIQFCRIFSTAADRDSYYEDIRYMSELNDDYKRATIEMMRRQMGF